VYNSRVLRVECGPQLLIVATGTSVARNGHSFLWSDTLVTNEVHMSAVSSIRTPSRESADQQLVHRIQRQLAADSRAVSRLQIEVTGGVVTLRGISTSFYQKQLWLHGTKRVVGPETQINDEITVTPNWEDSDFGWRD
jgi:hypothetical protein